MTSFNTLLLDSFRMLKARTIFWITLGISILVAILYLSIGFNENGVTLFFGLTEIESENHRQGSPGAEILYTGIFINFIVGFWLSWIAIILALISCASIFPNTMEEGSAGMLLTKRPSRLLVFIAKYVGSLLFMLVQIGLFVLIVIIAMRWRLGTWNFSVFWFLPATLLVFSFLYSFLVMIAVKTRSTLTAILLTMLLWGITWIVGGIESQLFQFWRITEMGAKAEQIQYEIDLAEAEDQIAKGEEVDLPKPPSSSDEPNSLKKWYSYAKAAYAPLPKTTPVIEAAKNALVVNGKRGFKDSSFMAMMMGEESQKVDGVKESMKIADDAQKRHSFAYSLGTSLAFELVMLSLAAWMFCRRDF